MTVKNFSGKNRTWRRDVTNLLRETRQLLSLVEELRRKHNDLVSWMQHTAPLCNSLAAREVLETEKVKQDV